MEWFGHEVLQVSITHQTSYTVMAGGIWSFSDACLFIASVELKNVCFFARFNRTCRQLKGYNCTQVGLKSPAPFFFSLKIRETKVAKWFIGKFLHENSVVERVFWPNFFGFRRNEFLTQTILRQKIAAKSPRFNLRFKMILLTCCLFLEWSRCSKSGVFRFISRDFLEFVSFGFKCFGEVVWESLDWHGGVGRGQKEDEAKWVVESWIGIKAHLKNEWWKKTDSF